VTASLAASEPISRRSKYFCTLSFHIAKSSFSASGAKSGLWMSNIVRASLSASTRALSASSSAFSSGVAIATMGNRAEGRESLLQVHQFFVTRMILTCNSSGYTNFCNEDDTDLQLVRVHQFRAADSIEIARCIVQG